MHEQHRTVVAEARWVWPAVWVLFPLLGVGLMWLLKLGSGWVAQLPAAPLQGWFGIASAIPEPWVSIAAVVLGLLGGGLVAAQAQQESLTVTVEAAQLTLSRGETVIRLDGAQVGAVFLDGKELVVLCNAGAELARLPNDREHKELARAFAEHSYPWHPDGDPYRDRYRRWVPNLPDLPEGADALFTARQEALQNKDHDNAAQLRTELAALGLVVRDEDGRQFWRKG